MFFWNLSLRYSINRDRPSVATCKEFYLQDLKHPCQLCLSIAVIEFNSLTARIAWWFKHGGLNGRQATFYCWVLRVQI